MERGVPAQAQFPPLRPAEFGVDPARRIVDLRDSIKL